MVAMMIVMVALMAMNLHHDSSHDATPHDSKQVMSLGPQTPPQEAPRLNGSETEH